ncbi:hypothetical protein LOTGIDRAFT_228678 [Lottia gigantea]|uniref:Jacalin-type lectin domain-containing protein n=1 Tax=Lottia gigantea TaxID=225164 RepID=V4AB45_LOTGI|nr:hypothetical protein LOTGIDRAFT_228678 [Lottia gigantea]ESO94012.1 hypothetical protein LOTGIDRAFT_228678 [Lottia gigantea]
MGFFNVVVLALTAIFSQTNAQFGMNLGRLPFGTNFLGGSQGGRTPAMGLLGSSMMGGNPGRELLTCIGSTASEDSLRVTFEKTPNRFNRNQLEMSAKISAGMNSQMQGTFQLVVTEFGHIEGYCDANSLGPIMNSQSQTPAPLMALNFWRGTGSGNRVVGIIGDRFDIFAQNTVSIKDTITTLPVNNLPGSGIALCAANEILGNQCMNTIPLCCTITKDNMPADSIRQGSGLMQGAGMGGMGQGNNFSPMGSMGAMGSMGSMGPMGSMGSMGSIGPMGGNMGAQQPVLGGQAQAQQGPGSMIFPGNGR